jgi:hypothetical protein
MFPCSLVGGENPTGCCCFHSSVAVLFLPSHYGLLGSDAILTSMRREYNRTDFCHVVDTLKAKVCSAGLVCVWGGDGMRWR